MADGGEEEDKVGYKKPPKKHRFKKGHSGNTAGRKPKSKQIATLIERELNEKVVVRENGVAITLTKREAIVKKKVNAALNGSDRAMDYLIKFSIDHGAPDPFVITDDDRNAVKAALRRENEAQDGRDAQDNADKRSPKEADEEDELSPEMKP